MWVWSSHNSEIPHLYSGARPSLSVCLHLNQIQSVKRKNVSSCVSPCTGSAVSAFLHHSVVSGFDESTGKTVQLCGHVIICCSWANKSEINNSSFLLFVDLESTRNNVILLNLRTAWLYFFIFFLKLFSSKLSGSPPTARPSTPPNQRNNSLQGSANLKYKLTVSLCVGFPDGDVFIAS